MTADSALRLDPGLAGYLAELRERFTYVAGPRTARLSIPLADGRSESPGESVTRVQFHRYDIPMPILQYPVFDRLGRAMVMPQQARRTMAGLRHSLEQSRRLYVRGRVVIAS